MSNTINNFYFLGALMHPVSLGRRALPHQMSCSIDVNWVDHCIMFVWLFKKAFMLSVSQIHHLNHLLHAGRFGVVAVGHLTHEFEGFHALLGGEREPVFAVGRRVVQRYDRKRGSVHAGLVLFWGHAVGSFVFVVLILISIAGFPLRSCRKVVQVGQVFEPPARLFVLPKVFQADDLRFNAVDRADRSLPIAFVKADSGNSGKNSNTKWRISHAYHFVFQQEERFLQIRRAESEFANGTN